MVSSCVVLGCIGLAIAFPFQHPHPDAPLSCAAFEGRTEEVRRLVAREGAANALPDRWSALMWAARAGQVDAMKALVDAGADVNLHDQGPNGWTALLHAVHKDQQKAVSALLGWGADPNARSENGCTALMLAAGQGEKEIVAILLHHGADPRARTTDGTNALANAVANADPEIVDLLLKKAPDLKLSDNFQGLLSLWVARIRGHGEIVAQLRRAGAIQ